MVTKHSSTRVENYVALDIETLGGKVTMDHVISIGLARVRDGQAVAEFEVFPNDWELRDIAWGHPTERRLLAEMHARARAESKALGECLRLTREFLGNDVIVGQNIARFDLPILNKWLAHHRLPELTNAYVDMVPLARRLYPQLPNHRLHTLTAHHNLGQVEHTALADAVQEHLLYERMKADMPPGGLLVIAPRPRSRGGYWRR